MKVSIRMLYVFFATLFFLICSIFIGVEPMFVLVLVIWTLFIFYACNNLKDRSMLFAFLIAFFIFLLGRDFVQQFFKYQIEFFDPDTQFHVYFSEILSLVVLAFSYMFFAKCRTGSMKKTEYEYRVGHINNVRKISQYVYYMSWMVAVISRILVGRFVSNYGFTSYYIDYSEYLRGNTILYLISKVALIMPVAWCIYLSTRPPKDKIRIPLLLYLIYLGTSIIGTGQRSTALLGLLFLFVYFMYRNGLDPSEHWITRKITIIGTLALPLIAVFVSAYSEWRESGIMTVSSFNSGIMDFFYDQGVTSNITKRAFMYKERIPDQIYTLEFLHSGILARLLNIKVYHGNTVEHAMYGGSFTHSLGYVVLGSSYLAGRGTGSCYIAELYQDFGYLGILLGNILYGFILVKIANREKDSGIFWTSIKFYIITQIIWAVRASFSGFISQLLAPTTIATFIFIFGLAYMWEHSRRSRNYVDNIKVKTGIGNEQR